MKLFLKSVTFFVVLSASLAAFGQSLVDGRVVFGNQFKPVPQMTVHLVNNSRRPPTDSIQQTTPDGRYSFDDVPPGKGYSVAVYDSTGNVIGTDAAFEVFPDQRHVAVPNIDISKGVLADRAALAGGLIQNDKEVAPGANISNQQLRLLPLYNRNFLALGAIQPGVHDVPAGSPLQGAGFSIAGSPVTSTNFLLEGVDDVASSVNQAIPFQVNEAVQEFRVIYAAPDMRYGQGSGGVINIVTSRGNAASGGKAWHGSIFDYVNTDALNANSPLSVYSTSTFAKAAATASDGAGDNPSTNQIFIAASGTSPGYTGYTPQYYNQLFNLVSPGSPIANGQQSSATSCATFICQAGSFSPASLLGSQDSRTYPITSQQFGVSTGGPLLDNNKLFFFISYEGTRINNPTPIFERTATFDDKAGLPTSQPGTATDASIASGVLGLLPTPNVGQTGSSRAAGTGAGIFGFYRGFAPNYTHVDNLHIRPELSLGSLGTLSLRYTGQLIDQLHDDTLPSGGAYPGNGADRKAQNQSAAITHSFPFKRNLNVMNIGFTQFRVDEVAQDRSFNGASLGLPAGSLSTFALSGIDTRTTGATASTPGIMGGWYDSFWNPCLTPLSQTCPTTAYSPSAVTPSLDGQFPFPRLGAPLSAPSKHRDTEAFFSDILDLHFGTLNNLTVGGDYRYQQNFSYDGSLVRGLVVSNNIGEFTHDSETCISCGAAFAHPSFDYELRQPIGYTGDLRSSSFGVFAEHKFQPMQNLTFSLGVRYEYFGQQLDAGNRMWNYNVAAQGVSKQGLVGTYDAFDYKCGALNSDGTGATTTLDSFYGVRRVNFANGWNCNPNATFGLPDNKNNVMGHFGLSYSPDANYHNVFRASGGLYYDHLPSSYNEQLLHNRPSPYNVSNPSAIYGQNFDSTGCVGQQTQCAFGLHSLAFQTLNASDAANFQNYQAASGANILYERDPKNLHTPYSIQFATSIQHTFGPSWAGEIGYVGSVNKHLPLIYDGNFTNEFYCTQGGSPTTSPNGLCNNDTFFPVFTESNFGASSYHSLVMRIRSEQWHGLSMHAAYTLSKSLDDVAGSRFPQSTDSLWSQLFGRQLLGSGNPAAFALGGNSLRNQFVNSSRFALLSNQAAVYGPGKNQTAAQVVVSGANIPSFNTVASALTTTGSRSVDVSQYSLPQNPIGFTSNYAGQGGDYGRSDFDVRNRIVADFVYLPSFQNKWIKGFILSGIFTAQSGQPFSIFSGPAYGQVTQRVNLPSTSVIRTTGKPSGYFSGVSTALLPSVTNTVNCPNLYATPTLYSNKSNPQACVGNSPRNGYSGPIYMSQDLALQRSIPIREHQSIVLRVEGFNIFNRANYYNPISELSNDGVHLNPEFGLIRSAHDPLSIQFAGRFQF